MRTCAKCGEQLPPPKPGGQRRYCVTCSPPRPDRIKADVLPLPQRGQVYEATHRTLAEAGLLNHWRGQILLVLAEAIDADTGSGSSLAALAKTFRESFESTLEGHRPQSSPLDALRRRRQKKSNPCMTMMSHPKARFNGCQDS